MKKKHYELIASSIRRTDIVNMLDKNKLRRVAKRKALVLVANDLAGTFYGDDPKFDRDEFLKACGVIE